MQTFQFTSQISQEGILNLRLPAAFANQEVEIILVVHPKSQNTQTERPIGQYAGKMQMSEDFSAPLPDEFWSGEMP